MPEFAAERQVVADACRVLAARGLAPGFLGHVSLRAGDERLLVRCRGPRERGLAWTTPEDVRLVDFDGSAVADGELDGWTVPHELPLHTEVLRTRPDVSAVVHAHPEDVVVADLAGLGIRPIVGSLDIPGARLAARGVPIFPRGVLIRTRSLAADMTAAMGDSPVVLLRGHGLTSAAAGVPEAVLQALSVDRLARIALAVVSAGGALRDLPPEELAELPELGSGLTTEIAWRHELARLTAR